MRTFRSVVAESLEAQQPNRITDPHEMSSPIASRELTVDLENGLHMVPCSAIVKAVQGFEGAVRIRRVNPDYVASADSVFDLLGLQAEKGTVLTLEAEGDRAEEVLDRLVAMFADGFDVRR
jgi:phosphotransferase system HPr (HPr) family protein